MSGNSAIVIILKEAVKVTKVDAGLKTVSIILRIAVLVTSAY